MRTIEDFMSGQMPDDITLGEARAYMLTTPALRDIASQIKKGEIRLRFLHTADNTTEFHDACTLGYFRGMVRSGHASIAIDDLGGGTKVLEKEPA